MFWLKKLSKQGAIFKKVAQRGYTGTEELFHTHSLTRKPPKITNLDTRKIGRSLGL